MNRVEAYEKRVVRSTVQHLNILFRFSGGGLSIVLLPPAALVEPEYKASDGLKAAVTKPLDVEVTFLRVREMAGMFGAYAAVPPPDR